MYMFILVIYLPHRDSTSMEVANTLAWTWHVGSWCMCYYVTFASGEGWRWFSLRLNPYLIAGAAVGIGRCVAGARPPRAALMIMFLSWTWYAMLVSVQSWRWRLFTQQILPVCTPLVVLFCTLMLPW